MQLRYVDPVSSKCYDVIALYIIAYRISHVMSYCNTLIIYSLLSLTRQDMTVITSDTMAEQVEIAPTVLLVYKRKNM